MSDRYGRENRPMQNLSMGSPFMDSPFTGSPSRSPFMGEGSLSKGERRGLAALFFLTLLSFLYYFIHEGHAERLTEPHNQNAFVETFLFSLLLYDVARSRRLSRKPYARPLAAAALCLLQLYLHRMILPFFLSGLYFSLLAIFFLFLFGQRPFRKIGAFFRDRISSSAPLPEGGTAGSAAGASAIDGGGVGKLPYSLLPFLMIQLNRMNIAADYDSLRYGLRTNYVLLQGDGFWEKCKSFFSGLGMLNAVYAYPKGLEVLSAPLCTYHSFALLLMFQFWTMLAAMGMLYLLLRDLSGSRRRAFLGVLFMAGFCSVTNMSITAKTDLMTLFLQLVMLYFFQRGEYGRATASAILSYAMKPTSVVFTTVSYAALFAAQLVSLRKHGRGYGGKALFSLGELPPLLFSLLFTGLMTLRTFLITGVPYSTTFTSIFQAMGFHVNWPFNLDADMGYGTSRGFLPGMLAYFQRVFRFLFCPVGEDMYHVSIAWGGVCVPILLFFALRAFRQGGKALGQQIPAGEERMFRVTGERADMEGVENAYRQRQIRFLFLAVTAFSLLTFYFLWQVDGNYYMLWHSVLILQALGSRQGGGWGVLHGKGKDGRGTAAKLAVTQSGFPAVSLEGNGLGKGGLSRYALFLLFAASLLTTLLTSWAGTIGFTRIALVNRGYYDNEEEIENFQRGRGSWEIWNALRQDPSQRVLAFAETPLCYYIPCVLQSINDVEGSGGSPGLYDDPMYFEWFLKWAGADYIYIERGFLEDPKEKRAGEMLETLARHGMLHGYLTEGGEEGPAYILFRLDQERLQYVWDRERLAPPADEAVVTEALYILQKYAYTQNGV